jgi:hypothetical protein
MTHPIESANLTAAICFDHSGLEAPAGDWQGRR